jgi:hypothetical protein
MYNILKYIQSVGTKGLVLLGAFLLLWTAGCASIGATRGSDTTAISGETTDYEAVRRSNALYRNSNKIK